MADEYEPEYEEPVQGPEAWLDAAPAVEDTVDVQEDVGVTITWPDGRVDERVVALEQDLVEYE